MRGKAIFEPSILFITRITPAYAGKSSDATKSGMTSGDHPRLCGEKLFMDGEYGARIGSPPPMRGKGLIVL